MAMVRNGQIALPRFQRFESYPSLIENLLGNIIKELPIGSFLVLEVSGEHPLSFEGLACPSTLRV